MREAIHDAIDATDIYVKASTTEVEAFTREEITSVVTNHLLTVACISSGVHALPPEEKAFCLI